MSPPAFVVVPPPPHLLAQARIMEELDAAIRATLRRVVPAPGNDQNAARCVSPPFGTGRAVYVHVCPIGTVYGDTPDHDDMSDALLAQARYYADIADVLYRAAASASATETMQNPDLLEDL